MDIAIRRHFDGDIEDKELTRKHKAEKVFFGKQVIKSLEQRCSKFGDLKSLLLQAKTDVEDFLRKEKCEEISDEYLREEFTDIDRYIEGIIKNYSVLKEAIESSAD